jgi:CubicO group peptidase (beta-lactamase class C family)
VFVTGLDLDFAAENVGYFTAPYAARAELGKPVLDRLAKTVSVRVPGGPTREAVDAAFRIPAGMTAAFVVTYRRKLIAERYAPGISATTRLESWSMGKSVTASLMGILIGAGRYDLWQAAPVPEWQSPGDPRAAIRIADLLRMSSGLRIRAPYDPDYDPGAGYPDHLYLYTAPAWLADGQPVYGGFFWLNGDGAMPIPKDAYYMDPGTADFHAALALLVRAVAKT